MVTGRRYVAGVQPDPSSRRAVEFLIRRGRLETIDGTGAAEAAELMLGRAERRLLTAAGGISFGDLEGGFAAAYDAYRISAEGLLVRQGIRATGGDGSHMAAISQDTPRHSLR